MKNTERGKLLVLLAFCVVQKNMYKHECWNHTHGELDTTAMSISFSIIPVELNELQ